MVNIRLLDGRLGNRCLFSETGGILFTILAVQSALFSVQRVLALYFEASAAK